MASVSGLLCALILVDIRSTTLYSIPFIALAAFFAMSEIFVVHFEFGRESHTFSLVELPLVIGLLFARPLHLVAAHALGATLALLFHRKQSFVKLTFNVAAFALEDCVALLIFHGIVPTATILSISTWVGALAATISASLISILAVSGAIALSNGKQSGSDWAQRVGFGMFASVVTTSVGLVLAILATTKSAAIALLATPITGMYVAHRVYIAHREEHQSLEFLHASTRVQHQSEDLESRVFALLDQARRTFRTDVAALSYSAIGDPDHVALTVVGPDDARSSLSVGNRGAGWDTLLRTTPHSYGCILSRRDGDLDGFIDGLSLDDAMIVPLHGETLAMGHLLVANRQSDVSHFSTEELRVFETFAGHVSLGLESGELEHSVQQLRIVERQLTHRATHDPLTGLANRTLFIDRLADRLTDAAPESIALIAIDLDDFKTVNDTWGHQVGDKLLMVLAQRLRSSLRGDDLAVRVGGDEFAVLADAATGQHTALRLAERINSALTGRVNVDGIFVNLAVSIGVALNNEQSDIATLLDDADKAMYIAKARGKGCIEVFRPEGPGSPVGLSA
jgi:diguanylate cyclase (GGDEF)-like protein